jgi:intracellular septation protein
MKLLFDLFPVILFFLVFKIAGTNPEAAQNFGSAYLSGLVSGGEVSMTQAPILLATAVTILATIAQITLLLVRRQRVDNMLWVSLVIIVFFGGATIYFHDEQFIKLKPTVLYWFFAIALLVSPFLFKKNLIKSMMSQQLALPDPVWTQLNFAWGGFFSLMGVLNLYIAFNYPLEFWVNFKLFGFIGLMIVFVVIQSIYLSRYIKETDQESE